MRSIHDLSWLAIVKLYKGAPITTTSAARNWPPEDLQGLDTVAMSSIDGRATWHQLGLDGASYSLIHQPRYLADDMLTLQYAVRAGVGMCMLPDYMCRDDLQRGLLVEALPGWAPRPALFHAVFPSRRGLLPAVRSFLDFLADTIKAEGYILAV